MKSFRLLVFCLIVTVSTPAQIGLRGQIFLPNGSPAQKRIRFTLTTDNGIRTELFYTDSNGRIAMPAVSGPYTITVDSDGETYDTTRASFNSIHAGNYITINLRPLKDAKSNPPGLVDVTDVDREVSPKAKEAYDAALSLLQAGQYEQALEPLKRAVSMQANYFKAYNELGVVYLKLNQLDKAEEALRQAIKINDKIYLPQLNLAVVYNRQGKFKEASGILAKVEKSRPDLASLHAPLIEAFMGGQMWAQAEDAIKKALAAKNADVVDLKIKLGIVSIRQKKLVEAIAALREATKAEPANALAQFNLGVALFQASNLDEAETVLLNAYKIAGAKMAGAQLMLGQVYFQKENYEKAIASFEIYLRDLPDAPNATQVKEAVEKLRQSTKKP
jgi:tetratricopeptide (TPR) repeat protein